MPRRFIRHLLVLGLLLSSEVWALGLGEIRLNSALNEPLRAEIILLGATPEELGNLEVALASAPTFERYGIERPFYLQELVFDIVRSGQAEGSVIRVRSAQPITEPFLTFLVEATWARGRLLREYTVLLDPPTFAPLPVNESQPAMTAPQRSTPTDSGRIDRTPPPQQAAPSRPAPARPAVQAPQPTQPTQPQPQPTQPQPTQPQPTQPQPTPPKPEPVADNTPYDTSDGDNYIVQRGETLWGIASAMRPDSRLSMNQTMLAIYEANRQAFQNNINILSAGAALRLPSADDIYRIDRRDALSEVLRQHSSWGNYVPPVPAVTEPDYVDDSDTRPSLTLVPPDDDTPGIDTGTDTGIDDIFAEPDTREQEVVDRIAALEGADVPIQQSLIEIHNNELAALRQELANIRGEVYEAPVDDLTIDTAVDIDDEVFVDDSLVDDELLAEPVEDTTVDDATDDTATTTSAQGPSSILIDDSPSLVDQAIAWITSKVGLIVLGVLVLVAGLLFWFMRRGDDDDDDSSGAWNALDSDEDRMDPLDATETLQAPHHDESIVVVEEETGIRPLNETIEAELPDPESTDEASDGASDETTQFESIENTFSSETALNLDQSDPVAEADFHMAYGLYDQAADLINGALQVEPERQELLTKLCEIYFVWGNRDSFVDAAQRLKDVTGGGDSDDWNKIVIMGQQIAADDALFAGAGVAGATREVDLSFESDSDTAGALDMDFGDESGSEEGGSDDIIDLGAADATNTAESGIDFPFDNDETEVASPSNDASATEEMPTIESQISEDTVASPTIEDQFANFDVTSELPSIDNDALDSAIEESGHASDATAEIDLDDLDLNIDGLAETEIASLDDLDDMDVTGTNETLAVGDLVDVTGKNLALDKDATGMQPVLDPDVTGTSELLKVDDGTNVSKMRLAADETGRYPVMDIVASGDAETLVGDALLDATGETQILDGDFAVATAAEEAGDLGDDQATMLAPMDGDDESFDFANTERLEPDVFTGSANLDVTGELPVIDSADVDMDLNDLAAALKESESRDADEQFHDAATVEQIRPPAAEDDLSSTMGLSSDDMSEDLQEARTMTEVGTKLDLARAYVDMGDPAGARGILEEVLDEGDEGQRQQAQQLLDSLPS